MNTLKQTSAVTKLIMVTMVLLIVSMGISAFEPSVSATTSGYDLNKVKEAQENVSIDSLMVAAKEYSLPILITIVVISGFTALGGLVFKPLKAAAGSLLGVGIVFFVLVNFAPQIVGIMISVVNSIMERITGT